MKDDSDWIIDCPCGHSFSAAGAKNWRGRGGKWLNQKVEHSQVDSKIEVQCPKCLMWLNSTTGDIE